MRESRTSGLMSGEGKRGVAEMAQATAPFLDSTQLPLIYSNLLFLRTSLSFNDSINR
jgi:hypothetical protein